MVPLNRLEGRGPAVADGIRIADKGSGFESQCSRTRNMRAKGSSPA